jgi:hypothetical protein
MFLPDINVWLAVAFEAHEGHLRAKTWFDSLDDESCVFCRMTQTGFLRLATNPSVFKDEALTLSEAWSSYDELLGDPRVGFSQEPLGLENLWRKRSMVHGYSPKIWNDAYLSAFSEAGGLRLATFDKGFSAYKNSDYILIP